jgi:hypothetical protein
LLIDFWEETETVRLDKFAAMPLPAVLLSSGPPASPAHGACKLRIQITAGLIANRDRAHRLNHSSMRVIGGAVFPSCPLFRMCLHSLFRMLTNLQQILLLMIVLFTW